MVENHHGDGLTKDDTYGHHLLSLVLVKDGRHEEEDWVTEEPEDGALGEAEVEVSLECAPLGGGDGVEDRGEQQSEDDPQSKEQQASGALLTMKTVMIGV